MEQQKTDILKCDACRKDSTMLEIRYISLKACCSVKRIPLCYECYEKYTIGNKMKSKGDGE